ncbi:class I adenylate-forming enzyme family protein [Virgibacillus sp. SK37]|uniref:class I adenylate-forming enzyme family protein n=1 Tax=Virgibacillus sp. SK37 TaxID=403957 RepID=UPI0004D10764|nr:hypothetical protein X953_13015 [Virgibacillus sp. SK37]
MIQTQVRVVNKYGEDVKHDGTEVGEVIVKGNGTEHFKNKNSEGWVYTGDLGTIDKNGKIHVIDRKKDIDTAETKISSVGLERLLLKHPSVQEASVVPVPHEKLGEVAHAFVVLYENQHATEEELIEYCLRTLKPSECPKAVTFMEELPKTASGKILKVQLQGEN